MTARYATQAAALTAIVKARQLISAGKVETDSWEHNRKYGGGWSAAIRFGDIRISTANDDRWRGAYSCRLSRL